MEGRALVFDDLWIRHFGGPAQYEWRLEWEAPDPDMEETGATGAQRIELPEPAGPVPAGGDPEESLARLEVWKIREDGRRAPRPATFWLRWLPAATGYELVGVRY